MKKKTFERWTQSYSLSSAVAHALQAREPNRTLQKQTLRGVTQRNVEHDEFKILRRVHERVDWDDSDRVMRVATRVVEFIREQARRGFAAD